MTTTAASRREADSRAEAATPLPLHIGNYMGGIQSISVGCGKWFGLAPEVIV